MFYGSEYGRAAFSAYRALCLTHSCRASEHTVPELNFVARGDVRLLQNKQFLCHEAVLAVRKKVLFASVALLSTLD